MVKFSQGINTLKIAVSSYRDLKEFDRGMDREELEFIKSLTCGCCNRWVHQTPC